MTESSVNMPLVSVIIPSYNSAEYLADALNSVLLQTYANWECIVLDDGSTDNTREVAAQYSERDKRIKYFHQSNKGLSAARNAAIKNSRGKYILPLDADDKISPKYLAEAVAVLEKSADVKLVYCLAEFFGGQSGSWNIPDYSYRELLIQNLIFCSAIFRKEDFEKTRGYNENMKLGFEDWEFWIRFLNENDKVVRLPDVHFYYRIKESSMRLKLDVERRKKIRRFIYEEYKELYDKHFNTPDLLYDYDAMRNEYNELRKLYSETLQSATFKIGRAMLKPYWFIKSIFK